MGKDAGRGVNQTALGAGDNISVAERPYWLVTEWWGLVLDCARTQRSEAERVRAQSSTNPHHGTSHTVSAAVSNGVAVLRGGFLRGNCARPRFAPGARNSPSENHHSTQR